MKITSQEEYGLRCLVQIARHAQREDPKRPMPISEIARAEGISVEYAGKLLSLLRHEELVQSVRGKLGGYVLAREPAEITLLQLVTAPLGPIFEQDSCTRFTGTGDECVHLGDCGMRPVWWALSNLIGGLLDSITLLELCNDEQEVGASLQQKLLERIQAMPDLAFPSAAAHSGSPQSPTPLPSPALIDTPRRNRSD